MFKQLYYLILYVEVSKGRAQTDMDLAPLTRMNFLFEVIKIFDS